MRKIISLLPLLLLLVSHLALAQIERPDSAQNILKAAVNEALSSKKNVFLIFHATWCGWCKRLDTALKYSEIKPIIDKNYVVAMIDVKERGEKIQSNENPGGQRLSQQERQNDRQLQCDAEKSELRVPWIKRRDCRIYQASQKNSSAYDR
jgi:thioredoxin-related protein